MVEYTVMRGELMKVAQFLFWLGIAVIVVQLIGEGMMWVRLLTLHQSIIDNFGSMVAGLASPFVGGGTLIGLSKILEGLYSKDYATRFNK